MFIKIKKNIYIFSHLLLLHRKVVCGLHLIRIHFRNYPEFPSEFSDLKMSENAY